MTAPDEAVLAVRAAAEGDGARAPASALEDKVVLMVLPQQQAADGWLLVRGGAADGLHGKVAGGGGLEQARGAQVDVLEVPAVGGTDLQAIPHERGAAAQRIVPGPGRRRGAG